MDDLISRKALDREMSMQLVHAGFKSYSDAGQMYLKAKQIVRSAPAIDAAPVVHGEWIGYETSSYNGNDEYGEPRWIPKKFFRCSICRKGTAVRHNFCPNCGAKMDGWNDDENFSSLRRKPGRND